MENNVARRYELVIGVRLSPSADGGSFHGVTENISVSGVRVLARHAEPRGSLLALEFPKFGGIGEVIWTSEPKGMETVRMGLKFASLSHSARSELVRLMDSSTQGPPAPKSDSRVE